MLVLVLEPGAVQDGVLEAEAAPDPQQAQRARGLVEAPRGGVPLLRRLSLEQRAHLLRARAPPSGQAQWLSSGLGVAWS